MQKFEDVKEMLESLDDKILENPEVIKIRKLLESLTSNESILQQNPNDKVRLELSILYLK